MGVAQGWLWHALYPFPKLFEIYTLHTTMCSVLKWSQSFISAALMPLVRIKMCQKNVLNVQNSLQAVPQLRYMNNWSTWLHNPCRRGECHRFRAGGIMRSSPQVGKVAT